MFKSGQSLSKKAASAFVVAAFCWLNVLAASPVLHAEAHCHEGRANACHPEPVQSSEHRCAVMLLAQGQIALVVPPAVPAAPLGVVMISRPVAAPVFCSVDLRLAPGRAPPVLPA